MFLQQDNFLLSQSSSVFIKHISGVTHSSQKTLFVILFFITRVTNKVALCFSDQSHCVSRLEFDAIIRLDDIMRHSQQKLSVVEVRARDGQGLAKVVQWIKEHAKPQT